MPLFLGTLLIVCALVLGAKIAYTYRMYARRHKRIKSLVEFSKGKWGVLYFDQTEHGCSVCVGVIDGKLVEAIGSSKYDSFQALKRKARLCLGKEFSDDTCKTL